jgi:hypothetical protein
MKPVKLLPLLSGVLGMVLLSACAEKGDSVGPILELPDIEVYTEEQENRLAEELGMATLPDCPRNNLPPIDECVMWPVFVSDYDTLLMRMYEMQKAWEEKKD